MNIGLIDVDSHNFPNLALMKLSAWHKQNGDNVEWWNGLKHYDRVYKSKVFDDTYSQDEDWCIMADEIIKGGTGYDLQNKLPDDVEHTYPDYSLYGIKDTAYGFLTRGCPRHCPFCIVSGKEGRTSYTVADLDEFWRGQNEIVLMDSNITASKDCEKHFRTLADANVLVDFEGGLDIRFMTDEKAELLNRIRTKQIHFAWDNYKDKSVVEKLERYSKIATNKPHGKYAMVYVLTNFDTTIEEDLERIYILDDLGYDPFVMIYDKPNAPKELIRIQRWCNNKWVYGKCKKYDDNRSHIPRGIDL